MCGKSAEFQHEDIPWFIASISPETHINKELRTSLSCSTDAVLQELISEQAVLMTVITRGV